MYYTSTWSHKATTEVLHSRYALDLNRGGLLDPFLLQRLDEGWGELHLLERSEWRREVSALHENVTLLAHLVVVLWGSGQNVAWWAPAANVQCNNDDDDDDDDDNNKNNNNNNNYQIERCNLRFLQFPHCTADCLQHNMLKWPECSHVQVPCNMLCASWYRDSTAMKFDRV